VEEVARAAGVGTGTLYRHFPTKESLIAALVDATVEAMAEIAEQAVKRQDGAGLEWFLEAASELQAANRGCLPRLWRQNPEHERILRIRQLTARLLSDAKRNGRARPDLTETDITMILWSIRGVIETTGHAAPQAWRRHLSLLRAGLRPGQPPLLYPPLTRAQTQQITAG
jgi:AcrR family transcriptional regulator